MRSSSAAAALAAAAVCSLSSVATAQDAPQFVPTAIEGHFVEQFTPDWTQRWSPSKATKEEKQGEVFSYVGQWSVEEPSVFPGLSNDAGLVLKTKAAHHAISAQFDTPLDPKGKTLVAQYEVKLQKGLDCGGAYLKLLTDSDEGIQAEEFSERTPYTIMFGPDRCGATNKVHFIFRHRNPLSGAIEEKHLLAPPSPKITMTTALYTLIVRPDQTYEIKVNGETAKTGSLLEDFSPAVNPPKEIDDPEDQKPSDWVESPKIADPDAVKPADWDEDAPATIEDPDAVMPSGWLVDEPATIPDPDAEKPEEWSDEEDGDWIAPAVPNPACETAAGCGPWMRPEIPNPAYKGKWFAPLIDNPDYKGPWAPRKIANKDYFEDLTPSDFTKIAGVGFELWSMTDDILFDNIYIGTSESDAARFATETFQAKYAVEQAAEKAADAVAESAAKSKEGLHDDSLAPDYKSQPLAFAQYKMQKFMDLAVEDPIEAVKQRPVEGAAAATLFATVLGFLTVLFSFILPAKKTAKPVAAKKSTAVAPVASKKTDAATADDSDAVAANAKTIPAAVAAKTHAEETANVSAKGVRTRASAKAEKSDEE